MLRNTRQKDEPGVRRQDRLQKAHGEVEPTGQDVSRDIHTPISEPQTCRRLSQLLRRQRKYIYRAGIVQEASESSLCYDVI